MRMRERKKLEENEKKFNDRFETVLYYDVVVYTSAYAHMNKMKCEAYWMML